MVLLNGTISTKEIVFLVKIYPTEIKKKKKKRKKTQQQKITKP